MIQYFYVIPLMTFLPELKVNVDYLMKRFNGMSIPELVKLKVSKRLLMSVSLRLMYVLSPHDLPMYVHEYTCTYVCTYVRMHMYMHYVQPHIIHLCACLCVIDSRFHINYKCIITN